MKKVIPVFDYEEISMFFDENDIGFYLSEQLSDLNFFLSDIPGNHTGQIRML